MLKEFSGKTAVITGAASGIGLALCDAAIERGMNVVAADVNAEGLQALEKVYSNKGSLSTALTDVSYLPSVAALCEFAYKAHGQVHLLCNNAGVASSGLIWQHGVDFWKWIFDVNVMGVIHGLKQFIPEMIAQNQGSAIVNTASMGCLFSAESMGAYGASKHAVLAISDSLRKDLEAENAPISVSLLCPGPVCTPIFDMDRSPKDVEANTDREVWETYRNLIGTGIDPAIVASKTFDAIAKGEFWVLPNPEMIDLAIERHNQVMRAAGRLG